MIEIVDLENKLKFDKTLWIPFYGLLKLPKAIEKHQNILCKIGEELSKNGEEYLSEQQENIVINSYITRKRLLIYSPLAFLVGSSGIFYATSKALPYWVKLIENLLK